MSGGDFLSRWSRRKREVAADERPPVPDAEAAPPPDVGPDEPGATGPEEMSAREMSAQEMSAEEIAQLPPVESLTAASDLAQFLRAGVPALLRKAALRRMWSVDPGIRDYVSEAREYAYDWNVPGGVPGYGPMLPGDDIAQMVRDIFGGTPRTEVPDSEHPEPVLLADAQSDGADDEPMETATRSTDDPPPGVDEHESTEATAQHIDAAAVPVASEPAVHALAERALPAPAEPAARPRLRRHGGAVPL